MKSSKKLQFDDQVLEFVFKPRKPVTRKLKRLQEAEPEVDETGEISGFCEEPIVPPSPMHGDDRNRVVNTQEEENSYEEVKKKLKLTNLEIAKFKKRARKHVAKKANFNRMKALWEAEKASKPEVVSRKAQYFTRTVLAIKEARYVRWINGRLRTNIREMKRQIEDLEIQLRKSRGQPQHK